MPDNSVASGRETQQQLDKTWSWQCTSEEIVHRSGDSIEEDAAEDSAEEALLAAETFIRTQVATQKTVKRAD
jgi:hypothetical protein